MSWTNSSCSCRSTTSNRNCPSGSSQPFKQVQDRGMQLTCGGQPLLGSQALALASCLPVNPTCFGLCPLTSVEMFIELVCLIKMLFISLGEFCVMHILTSCSLLQTLVSFYKRMTLFTLNFYLPRYLKSGKYSLSKLSRTTANLCQQRT